MRLALITPHSLLAYTKSTDYQLILPHLCESNQEYQTFYQTLLQDSGQYGILDNGEAEGMNVYSADWLIGRAIDLGCKEVIAHDTIADAAGTIRKTLSFLDKASIVPAIESGPIGVGIVAQGRTHDETLDCLRVIASSPYWSLVKTIHIPRHIIGTTNNERARINLAIQIHAKYPDKDIHLLGASPYSPSELPIATKAVPFVRGMDTSMPFNYALARKALGIDSISRVENYFDLTLKDFPDMSLLHSNVSTMIRWAYDN